MLGPFATTSRLMPIHQMSLAVLSRTACASMSTTTTTTTHDRGDRYGPMEWAQQATVMSYYTTVVFYLPCEYESLLKVYPDLLIEYPLNVLLEKSAECIGVGNWH